MSVSCKLLCGLSLLTALITMPAISDEKKSDFDDYILTLQTDNDFYFTGTDEDYTFGQRMNLSFPYRKEPKWLMKAVDWMPWGKETKHRRYYISAGQTVFTPKDVSRSDIILSERPFAAYFYVGGGYSDPSDFHTDLFSLNVGWTGKLAMGELAQKKLHVAKGKEEPQGWDNQIGAEPMVMAQFVRIYSGHEGSMYGGKYWDMTPHTGLSIGTPNTHISSGLTFRVGTGLDRESGGTPVLQPQMAVRDVYHSNDDFAFNIIAGFETRVVLYDFALDGALFASNPHTVDKKTIAGQAYAGVVVYKGGWRIGYNHIFKSKEYTGQSRSHNYGSITISRYF